MRRLCLLIACLVAAGASASPAGASGAAVCPRLFPFIDAGRSDVMGIFAELGVRCQLAQNWTISTGFRYTDQRAGTLPFLILTYTTPLTTGVNLAVTASMLERGGDYEIDRLPELALQWTASQSPGPAVSVQLFTGSITTTSITPHVQTSRLGMVFDVSHPLRLSPSIDFTPSLRLGNIAYGTGDAHDFWIGTAVVTVRPTSKTDLGLAYLKQEGRGVSPLLFDVISFDHTLTGWVGFVVTPSARLGLSATANLFTVPSWTMKEYTLSWNQFGQWTASLTWRVTDGRVWAGFSLAR